MGVILHKVDSNPKSLRPTARAEKRGIPARLCIAFSSHECTPDWHLHSATELTNSMKGIEPTMQYSGLQNL